MILVLYTEISNVSVNGCHGDYHGDCHGGCYGDCRYICHSFYMQYCLSAIFCSYQPSLPVPSTSVQNILIDCHCNCKDIFQCPHEEDSGYRVYLSDFDSAVIIVEDGDECTVYDDMVSFGLLVQELFGVSTVDEVYTCTCGACS